MHVDCANAKYLLVEIYIGGGGWGAKCVIFKFASGKEKIWSIIYPIISKEAFYQVKWENIY